MKQRLQRRLEHIRQQPPEDRLKKVSTLVMLSAGAFLFLWLFLLLPIQLHVQSRSDGQASNVLTALLSLPSPSGSPATNLAASSPAPSRQPQVGGAQSYRRPLPSGPFFKTASPTPIPTPSSSPTP